MMNPIYSKTTPNFFRWELLWLCSLATLASQQQSFFPGFYGGVVTEAHLVFQVTLDKQKIMNSHTAAAS